MQIIVTVDKCTFPIPCGEGEQTFTWIGLVASQRYALSRPHGRSRSREDAHTTLGFSIPAQVSRLETGEVMHPNNRICDHCEEGEHLSVSLQHEVEVDPTGTPDLTAWTTTAFIHSSELRKVLLADPEIEKSSSTLQKKADIIDVHSDNDEETFPNHAKNNIKNVSNTAFQKTQLSGSLSTPQEIYAALGHDWASISITDLESDDEEQECIKDVFLDNYHYFMSAYTHYAAGARSSNYRMSSLEFLHFIHETKMFHMISDHKLIVKIMHSVLHRNDATTTFLSVPAFLEICFRIAKLWHNDVHGEEERTSSLIFEKAVLEKILPAVERMTTGQVQSSLHSNVVKSLLQERYKTLHQLYEDKANEDGLAYDAIRSIVRTSGILCKGEKAGHDKVLDELMQSAFSGCDAYQNPTDWRFVYAEFIEIIASIAYEMWQDEDLDVRDTFTIAFDAIRISQQ